MDGAWRWLGRGLLAAGLLAAAAAPAWAQRASQPRVIELEEMIIEGKVAKPQVFYVLGRSSIRYEQFQLDRTFVDRIVASARTNPF